MQKDAFYFPHFSNARHDRKIKRLRKELGIEGYGIFFMLLEVLREQLDFKYPVQDIDLLSEEFGTSEQKLRCVVCNYQLFEIDEKEQFFSPKFYEYMQPYLRMKEQRILAAQNSVKSRKLKLLEQANITEIATTVQRPFNDRSTDVATTVKQSKVKESKENIYSPVIDLLNKSAKTQYKDTTQKTRDLIDARQKEGFVLDDFAKVIEVKCKEWVGTPQEIYLRPETLFSNKFESYLNQKVSPNKTEQPKDQYRRV